VRKVPKKLTFKVNLFPRFMQQAGLPLNLQWGARV